MAVAYRAKSAAAGQNSGTTTTASTVAITPTFPATDGTTVSGDRVFIFQEHSAASAGTTPNGWTVVGTKDLVIGSGAVAAASGLRRVTVYARDYDGVWAMPSFDLTSAAQNSHWLGAISVSKGAGEVWNPPTISTVGGAFNSATTSYTDTTAASFTTHSGGFLLICTGLNDNVTSTTPALSQTGATFASLTERCDGGTATGNDAAGQIHTATVTTGAAATMTFTQTLSAASQGETLIVEQTVSTVTSPPAFQSAGTALAYASTTAADISVPSGVSANDIIVALLFVQYTQAVTPPAGFTQAADSPVSVIGSNDHYLHVFWKRQTSATGAGETTGTYGFTVAGGLTGRSGVALRYSGCVTSGTPFDVTAFAVEGNGAAGAHPTPAVSDTTTVDNTLLVWVTSSTLSDATLFPPLGFSVLRTAATGVNLVSADKPQPTGATGSIQGGYDRGGIPSDLGSWLGALLPSMPPSGTISSTAKKLTASLTAVQSQTGTVAATAKKPTAALTGVMQPKGSIAATAKKATAAFTGAQSQTGAMSATAKKPTAALTGAMQPKGTIAAQLSRALFSGAGAQTQTGTVAALLKKATASLTGAEQPSGTAAATMRKATASFTGAQTQSGSVAATLRAPTASFTGAMQPKGVLAGITGKVTATLTGTQQQVGVVSAASKNLTASLVGAQQPSGTISATAQPAAFTATGTQTVTGAIAATARSLAAALAGALEQPGTISVAMKPAVATLAGAMHPSGFVTVTLLPAVFAASGTQTQTGVIDATAQAAAAAMVGALYPDGAISSTLTAPLFDGSGTQTAPPGTAAVTMNKLDASLSGHEAPEGALGALMQPTHFSGQGEQGQQGILAATLRAATFAAMGSQPTSGALAAALHRMVFAGQGTYVGQASTGTMSAHAHRLVAALTGAMVPTGGISGKLHPPLFEGSADYFSPLGLRVVLRRLVFQSLRVALDSESRTTIIRGENRTTVIPGENRETFISGDNRLTLIE